MLSVLDMSRDLGLEAAPKPWAEMTGGWERRSWVSLGAGERCHLEDCLFSSFPRDMGYDSGCQEGRVQEAEQTHSVYPYAFFMFVQNNSPGRFP